MEVKVNAEQRQRIVSIDILRALTMVLMIFVNDLWSLQHIPDWLGHVDSGVDGMGLSDVVFPAFLFIVGLSLPYAVDNRRKKGDTTWQLIKHILLRSLALIIMGVFLVNGESFNASVTGMPKILWYPFCCIAFILIWNSYPPQMNKKLTLILRGTGIIALVLLGVIYRGGDDGDITRLSPHWWGILGLIGWAYLVSGLVTVLSKNNLLIILGGWLFFCVLSMVDHMGLVPHHGLIGLIPDPIRGGTLTGLTLGGVLTSLIFRRYTEQHNHKKLTMVLVLYAAMLMVMYAITRPYWGLSKLDATPAWLFVCSAITIIAFLAVYWIADVAGKAAWFNLIKAAGTGTLLCYLIPYFAYALNNLLGIDLPQVMLTGGIGLLKSFLFAVLCALITGWLIKLGIRLRL